MNDSTKTFKLERVRFFPKVMTPGTMYVSGEFGQSCHLCPCGCGSAVVFSYGKADGWEMAQNPDGSVTFYPSFSNKCGSKYFIRANTVVWCTP